MNDPKQAALYFASCIAGTALDFDKKSAPVGERKRHRQLCETVADIIRGTASAPGWDYDPAIVVSNLDQVAAVLRRYEE